MINFLPKKRLTGQWPDPTRKMRGSLVLGRLSALLIFVLLGKSMQAQNPAYTFASTSGTYSAISGGTIHSSGSGMDDATFSVTLPFSFNFNGTSYTQVYLSENGYISFGASNPGTTTRLAISSTNTGFELAAPFSGDLQGVNSTSELRSQVTGSAPNRTFIAQWTNLQFYLATGQSFNFQVQIDEANGVIANQVVRFVYGTVSNSSTADVTQVGLRGINNSIYNSRTTTTSWSSTTAATANSAGCAVSSTVVPASGLTFTWTQIPSTYTSSTTTQALTTPVAPGATNQQIIGVQVVIGGGNANPLSLTAMNLNTTGTTNPANITAAKVFYTGTSSTFATTTQYGSTVSSPSGSFSVTGSQSLVFGTNYFWVVYDVSASAPLGNVLDAQCTQLTISSSNYVPTVTNPAGTRSILTPLSGTYTIGAAGNFTSLTAAVNILNSIGVSGPVTFSLIDNLYSSAETFPIAINAFSGSSTTNTVTIKPATGVTATITGSSSSAIIALNGADNIIINGSNSTITRDLTISNSNTASGTAAIALYSLGTAAGATGNSILNCNIFGGANTTGIFGIYAASSPISTSGTGADNDNLTIQNNAIARCYVGVYAAATSTGLNNPLTITSNFIGSVNASDYLGFRGIQFSQASAASITRNTITGIVTGSASSDIIRAIESGAGVVSSSITGNLIYEINHTAGNFRAGQGISVGTGATGAAVTVSNNVIYGLKGHGSGTATNNTWGIMVLSGGGYNVYYNSINVSDNRTASGSTDIYGGVYIASGVTSLDLRNNAISVTGLPGNTTAGTAYSIYSLSASTAFSAINNNDYFASCARCSLGFIASTAQTTLTAWQTATGADANSKAADPLFNSAVVLRPTATSPLLASAAVIAGLTQDYLSFTRSGTAPTIGAYEQGGEFLPPAITLAALSNTPSTTNRTISSFATITDASGINNTSGLRPRLFYKKSSNANTFAGNTSADNGWKWVEATNTSSPYNFTIDYSILTGGSVTVGDVIQYFVVAQDLATTPNVAANPGVNLNGTPASVALNAGNFPVSGWSSYTIALSLSGFYNVGTGQQFTSLTNPGGFFEFVNNNAVVGDIIALVTSNLTETGAVALNQTAEFNGSGFTISIQPSAPSARSISGSVAGGLIRLNGADRITIDGRFNSSGNGKFLSFSNTNTSTNTAVIQLISLGLGAGVENVTIRNCVISAGTITNTSYGISAGDAAFGVGHNISNNNIFNNDINSCRVGISFAGNANTAGVLGTINSVNNNISNNNIGSSTPAQYVTLTGLQVVQIRNSVVRNNNIQNIVTTTGNSFGMFVNGNLNTTVDSNTIFNVSCAGNCYGIQLQNSDSVTIAVNNLDSINSSSNNVFGIQMGNSTPVSNSTAIYNRVKRLRYTGSSGYGGFGIDLTTTAPNANLAVRNNFVSDIYGDGDDVTGSFDFSPTGIRIAASTNNSFVEHNTVSLFGTHPLGYTGGTLNAAMFVGSSTSKLTVRNNILLNSFSYTSGTYTSYAIYSGASDTCYTVLNNNDYLSTSASSQLGFYTANRSTLADWKTAVPKDSNSVSRAVSFVNQASGDLRPTGASNGDFYLRCNLLPSVPRDIENNLRRSITYRGADEGTASLNMTVNAGLDTTICAGGTAQLGGSSIVGGGIAPYTYVWTPTLNTVSNPTASPATTTQYIVVARDSMGYTGRDTVVVNVTPLPAAPTAGTVPTVCPGGTAVLTATTTSGTLFWFDVATGGTSLGTGTSFTTPVLNVTDTFWVQAVTTCTGSRTRIIVPVTNPAAPVAGTVTAICAGNTATLTATASGTISWYKNATGGTALGTGSSYTTGVLNANDSFYVESVVNGCSSARTKVNVPVNALPAAPTVTTPAAICAGSSAMVIATSTGTKNWFTAATGGTSIKTGDTLTTAVLNANTTYFVEVTNANSCTSASRTPVTVTVNAIPAAPVVTTPGAICSGNATDVIAPSVSGATRNWFTVATGGSSVKTGDTLNTGTLTNTGIYYVSNTVNGCVSASRTAVTVTVNALPALPTVAPVAICEGSIANLSATGVSPSDTAKWYDAATAGTLLATGNTYNAGSLTASVTYHVAVVSAAGCVSNGRTAAVVTVNPIPATPALDGNTICENNSSTLDFSSVSGTLKWYDDNSATTPVFTGNVYNSGDLSANDTLYVSNTQLGCESGRDTVVINVTPLPAAPVATNTAVCAGSPASLSATGAGKLYWYTQVNGGSPIDSGASITVNGITATSIYYVESSNNGCTSSERSPLVVVFNNKPVATYTVQSQLAGTITFAATTLTGVTYQWNFGDNGTSILGNPSRTYATNGNYTVKLVVTNPTTGCKDSSSQTVNVLSVSANGVNANIFDLNAYPNPFTEQTKISYTLKNTETVSVAVVDVLGKEIMSAAAEQKEAGTHEIALQAGNNIKSGVYYVRLNIGGTMHTLRLVKVN